MPKGEEAKLRRRNRKKADHAAAIDMFGPTGDEDGDVPLPSTGRNIVEDDTDDDDDATGGAVDENLPKKKKKKKDRSKDAPAVPPTSGGGGGGIKTTPLILLIMMVGTTILPALIYAGDYASAFLAKNNVAGSLGYRMGIGAVPKKRVMSFYEKHAPEKLEDVPTILSKHYGDYPKLIKKLERKYQDYGYFMGWEDDEAALKLALEHLRTTYDVWLEQYWNRYAPQTLKTAFRNIRYNLTFLLKKFRKVWKKHIWPMLEPVFGVPDGGAAQKRKDAADARKKRDGGGKKTTRRRNTDFRDDVED